MKSLLAPCRVSLLVLLFLSATVGHAQVTDESPLVAGLGKRLNNFFDDVIKRRTPEAYGDLLAGSQLAKLDRQPQREQLIKKTVELETIYGRPRSYERFDARRIGADLVLFRYLYKCEDYPVVWHIAFYRDVRGAETPNALDEWRVISVKFDTDLEALTR